MILCSQVQSFCCVFLLVSSVFDMTDEKQPQSKDCILFYGHGKQHGKYRVFSQFYTSPFVDPETKLQFHCNEQWMMYHKAKLFGDEESAKQIMRCKEPAKIKQLGRQVKHFNEKQWDAQRLNIVTRGTVLKFSQNAELKAILFKFKFLNKQFAVCNHLFLDPLPQESLEETVKFLSEYNVKHVVTFVDKSDALTRLTHNVLSRKISQTTSRDCLFHHNPAQDIQDVDIFDCMTEFSSITPDIFLFEMKDRYDQCVADGDEYNQEFEEFEEAHYLGGQALDRYRTERCEDYLRSLSRSRKE